MNRFYKVTADQYYAATGNKYSLDDYEELKMPRRATALSAGYDFFAPRDIFLLPGHDEIIATGIGVVLDEDKFLMCVPRSGLGFAYHLSLANTLGVIDADFTGSETGGHIMAKIVNGGDRPLHIEKGKGFMQGIIVQYFKTDDDDAEGDRTGGLGSTDNQTD